MSNKAFTLVELIMVTLVIGILVGIAMPQFTTSIERSRSAEGVSILGAVRAAQLRYFVENGAYAPASCNFASSNCGLDIDISAMRFFNSPRTGFSTAGQLATITRLANGGFGQYTLYINEAGIISCAGGAAGACAKLGY